MFEIERVTSFERFAALETEWNALADTSPSPLLRHDWFTACALAFPHHELAVFLARRDGRLHAVAPLVLERTGPVLELRYLGHQTMEPEAFLADDEAALEAVCDVVLAAGRPLVIRRLGDESPELKALQARWRGRGYAVLRASSTQSYCTVLEKDWATFEKAMSGKRRQALRRQRSLLEQEGAVTFEMHEPGPDEVDAALEQLFQVEANSWKSRTRTALLSDEALRRFTVDYGRRAAAAGRLRMSLLKVDGQVISAQMDMEHGNRLWGFKMGADERWSKHGPGILSTHELIRWAVERGLEGCEHLGVAEEWQRRWPFAQRNFSTFRFYPVSIGGAGAFTVHTAEFLRRRGRERVRAWRGRQRKFLQPQDASKAAKA